MGDDDGGGAGTRPDDVLALVTDDQIGLRERGGEPRQRFLRARLDSVYGAEGYSCIERVGIRRDTSAVVAEVPDFWIGPIWFTLIRGANCIAECTIQWGRHYKRMRVRSGTTVTVSAQPRTRSRSSSIVPTDGRSKPASAPAPTRGMSTGAGDETTTMSASGRP
jgi:hypothetical protein